MKNGLEKDLRRLVRKVHKRGIEDARPHIMYYLQKKGFKHTLDIGEALNIYKKANIEVWVWRYRYDVFELF